MNQQKVNREKVADTSGDVLEVQIAKLRSLFHEVYVEDKLDFDKLKATLGGAAESGPGRFSFSWAGTDDALSLLQPTEALPSTTSVGIGRFAPNEAWQLGVVSGLSRLFARGATGQCADGGLRFPLTAMAARDLASSGRWNGNFEHERL